MRTTLLTLLALLLSVTGCTREDAADASAAGRVVIYTSVDQTYSSKIIEDFRKQTGIEVVFVTDAEATKSVGLAERVRAERDNPQADVWWGNEVFHTIRLAEEGLLAPYDSPSREGIPDLFRGREDRWTGTAARVRVIAVSDASDFKPRGLHDLTNPALKDRIAMARPTAGTTGGHVAAMFALWGEEKAVQYFRDLRANGIKLLGGNAVVTDQAGQDLISAGLTDNDDVDASLREGGKLSMVVPDQETFGTLVVPTTVGLIANARNPEAAKKLIDYLLSPEVEQRLISEKFARFSVRATEGASAVKPMNVDYAEVARGMPEAVRRATAILEGREE